MNANNLMWTAGLALALLGAPLLPGIINKIKAFFAGRRGPSLFQLYYDLAKLLRKGGVVTTASGGVFALAPCAGLALLLAAAVLLPHGRMASPLAFAGDFVLFFYLLGTARFVNVLGALETGSSFEGMGASREMQFSMLVEGVIFAVVCFVFFAFPLDSVSQFSLPFSNYAPHALSHLLVAAAFFVVLLAENCRVPLDDPETHLELTMIHEAMILDYAGPDLALIQYGAALKLWLFATLAVLLAVPEVSGVADFVFFYGEVLLTGVVVGCVESCMARFRFLKVPQMLLAALGLVLLGLFVRIFFEKGI